MCVRVGVVRVRVAGREIPLIAEIETIGSRIGRRTAPNNAHFAQRSGKVLQQPGMLPFKEKRAYTLQRDFCVLEREKRVSKILGSHAFRAELEGILQGQLDGSRSPPKPSRALRSLQESVVPTSTVEAARRGPGGPAASSVIQINDLRGARSSRYVLHERQLRCKLASLCRLVDWFKWSQLVDNHVSVSLLSSRILPA